MHASYLLDACLMFAGRLLDVCSMFAWSCRRGIKQQRFARFAECTVRECVNTDTTWRCKLVRFYTVVHKNVKNKSGTFLWTTVYVRFLMSCGFKLWPFVLKIGTMVTFPPETFAFMLFSLRFFRVRTLTRQTDRKTVRQERRTNRPDT